MQASGFAHARATQCLVLVTIACSFFVSGPSLTSPGGASPAAYPGSAGGTAPTLPHPLAGVEASLASSSAFWATATRRAAAKRTMQRQRGELWWRIPLSQFVVGHAGELAFEAYLLYHMRLLERQLGTRRYATHLAAAAVATAVTLIAATEASWAGLLANGSRAGYTQRALAAVMRAGPYATGPLAMVGAALARYQRHVPPTSRFRIFGFQQQEFTDKAFVALAAAQVALSRGGASLIPMALGFIYGAAFCEMDQ
ncbi:hypothetical protein PPROV_000392100 [Pycnococcus provasolii]|uniref:ABC transmembrane type-1 domain-containing protein n=1 Tax=Pycnococcus provasolii TaxID=41880 RepID=A0A830HIQ9_9CHLO|nr:hypothetical protein PPROV_000392100 [Pycnococcus provasolii]